MPLLETRGSGSAIAFGLNGQLILPSAWKSIQTINLSSDNSFIDFANIPQTYKHLKIIALIRADSGLNNIPMRLNGDSGSSWTKGFLGTDGTNKNGGAYPTLGSWDWVYGTNNTNLRIINEININNYTNNTKFKNVDAWVYSHHNSSSSYTNMIIQYGIGHWNNTSAVTSVTFTSSAIRAGSKFQLYGLEG